MRKLTKERCSTSKDKKPQWDSRRGTIMIKSNPYQLGGWRTDRRTIIPRSPCTIMKVLNCRSGFPAWGSNKGTGNPQVIWPWGPVGFDYRPFRVLGETETPPTHKQNLACTKPRGKEQWAQRRLNQNYILVLQGLLWRHGWAWTYHWSTGRSPLE